MNGDQPTNQTISEDYNQPVAYDKDGRPLYAHPPVQAPAQPQFVHMSRAVDPVAPEISADIKQRHEVSVKKYPTLNLSESEYIISEVRRHPVGLLLPIGASLFLILLTIVGLIAYPALEAASATPLPSVEQMTIIFTALAVLFGIGGYIAYYVYTNNKFFLTNESVIQEIQTSLFSKHEQTVSLGNIEDASFVQAGIIPSTLDYGSIRLSTEGDETTYRFHYVSNPKRQIAILNNAVEAFKNGRPVSDSDN